MKLIDGFCSIVLDNEIRAKFKQNDYKNQNFTLSTVCFSAMCSSGNELQNKHKNIKRAG